MATRRSGTSVGTTWKLTGGFPKVGIRPTVDGRPVRKQLEAGIMAQARSVSRLISSRLRYPDGSPVQCVIADTCIGGVAEAALAAEMFAREGVGVSLTVTNCWCYGSETMDMDPTMPKAVWGFNGTERPGAVYLAAVLAAHNQKGLPAFGIYGRDVQDKSERRIPADAEEKILRFVRAGLAAAIMRGKSYLAMGSVSMGIAGSIVDPSFFERTLGMRVENVDMSEFVRRLERGIYDPKEYAHALRWVRAHCVEGSDANPAAMRRSRKRLNVEWETCVKMAMIARDLMVGNPALARLGWKEESLGHHAILAGFQGQRQWTDHQPNGDFLETMLNSSFDWNGRRPPHLVATENDCLNGATMLFGYLLTNVAQVFADVRTYWSPAAVRRVTGHMLDGHAANGIIHLINSGAAAMDGTGRQSIDGLPAMKPFWDIDDAEVRACLKASRFHPSMTEYFPGGGFSVSYATRGDMPATMARINIVQGLGPVLQLAEGYTVELPDPVHRVLNERTDRTWPTTWFAPTVSGSGPFRDVYSVMNNWGANHGSLSYGHIGADLISLAAILRIPVSMHNVPEERIFRPSVWASFGAQDPTGADYRACANFGPLYG